MDDRVNAESVTGQVVETAESKGDERDVLSAWHSRPVERPSDETATNDSFKVSDFTARYRCEQVCNLNKNHRLLSILLKISVKHSIGARK